MPLICEKDHFLKWSFFIFIDITLFKYQYGIDSVQPDNRFELFESLGKYKNNPNPQMWFGLFFFGTPEGTRLHFCPCVRRAKIKVATSF